MTDTPDTQQQDDEQPDDGQAARWTRREPLLVLLSRMQRGALTTAERPLLRAAVETELADGDQAHAALAEARPSTGQRTTASDVLVQHDVTRKAMCDALGAGYHLNWQQLIDTAQRSHDANTEWMREVEDLKTALAEAVRARKAAEARARGAERATDEWRTTTQRQAAALRHAEAALGRVRRVVGWAANGWSDGLTPEKVLAALGDDQPAEAQPDVAGPAPRRAAPCWRDDPHLAHTWSWRWPSDAADCPGLSEPEEGGPVADAVRAVGEAPMEPPEPCNQAAAPVLRGPIEAAAELLLRAATALRTAARDAT